MVRRAHLPAKTLFSSQTVSGRRCSFRLVDFNSSDHICRNHGTVYQYTDINLHRMIVFQTILPTITNI